LIKHSLLTSPEIMTSRSEKVNKTFRWKMIPAWNIRA